ncbi:CD3324 family protein [Brevibacillus borstelensis]|uniref:CD3324 family protein n=1 Tax=Brevibacillus borstelensis TaxID=45462 RepID=UPI0030C08735
MKHEKAQNILPKHVVEFIQQYIDGTYVYIPRKSENRKAWGELTGAKTDLKIRNQHIYKSFLKGDSISELSQRHHLTEQSIRRIIREEKKKG